MGLVHSDYPRTKQFLPGYLYLSIVSEPLTVYLDGMADRKINELDLSDLVEFLAPFCKHYSWLIREVDRIKR